MIRLCPPGLAVAGLILMLSGCVSAPISTPADPAPAVTAVPPEKLALETGLSPVVMIVGEDAGPVALIDRMAHFQVPAVSIAVYRSGALDWTDAYGDGMGAATLFQAASLSKMVAATGIVALARERSVSLDADISDDLQGIDMAVLNPDGLPITLRALLSHTNGANVHGFPGYAAGEPVPSTLDVIAGSAVTNTQAVVLRRPNPDNPYVYSGGGYTIAQYWAEQVSGEDFAAMMQRLVLDPVGMTHSTFVQPLPDALALDGNAASAHDRGGQEIAGRWHTYPELAAAGLWTTSADFGRFLVALGQSVAGRTGTGIDPAVAAEVTAPVANDYGLGVAVMLRDGETVLQHSGTNAGYECFAMALPGRGDVIVVMTNAEGGGRLYRDIVQTANALYGWPSDTPPPMVRVSLSEAEVAALAGSYVIDGTSDTILELRVENGDVLGASPLVGNLRLVPVGDGRLVAPEGGLDMRYTLDGQDVRLFAMGHVLVKVAQE